MIYLGADFRGFKIKEKMKAWLREWGEEFVDLGAVEYQEGDDYPDYAVLVAREVVKRPTAVGILACGTGAGMAIAANKVPGARAVLALSPEHAHRVRQTDHVNILALPAEYLSEEEVKKTIRFFLETEYSTEPRYLRRVEKIGQIERDHEA